MTGTQLTEEPTKATGQALEPEAVRRIERTLALLDQLCTLLDRENAALDVVDMAVVEQTTHEKNNLIRTLHGERPTGSRSGSEAQDNEDYAASVGHLDPRLAEAETRFIAAMDANMKKLRALHRGSERVMQLIAEAARRAVTEQAATYKAPGSAYTSRNRNAGVRTPAMAVDRSL